MKLDPITLEVVINRLHEIGSTMEHLLFHGGYSTIVEIGRTDEVSGPFRLPLV